MPYGFSPEELKNRFNDFFTLADYFCQTYNQDDEAGIEVDPGLMYLVVVATYDDIARYKEYHLADPQKQRSNALKRAAYAAKWILRFNPLIVPKAGHISGSFANHAGLANTMFAIHFAMSNMQQLTGLDIDLSQELYLDLLYDMLYRNITGEPFMLVLELICSVAQGKPILDEA